MKKLSAIIIVFAVVLASIIFTGCSGGSSAGGSDLSDITGSGSGSGSGSDSGEVTHEDLTSVDQLRQYHFNADLLTKEFTGAKLWGNTIRFKEDGEFKMIKVSTVTFKSVDNSYAYCGVQKADGKVARVYVPAEFSVEGVLLDQHGTTVGDVSFDTLYGMVRLGNIAGNYDIYSDGDLQWIDGKHIIEVLSADRSALGDVLVEYMSSGLQLYNYNPDKYDLVRVDL